MTRKEKMDLYLARIPENDRKAFISDLRQLTSYEEIQALLDKHHIELSEDEKTQLWNESSFEISDETLDMATGGGCCLIGECECAENNCI